MPPYAFTNTRKQGESTPGEGIDTIHGSYQSEKKKTIAFVHVVRVPSPTATAYDCRFDLFFVLLVFFTDTP